MSHWRHILAIDHDHWACDTYRANMPGMAPVTILQGDVREQLRTLPAGVAHCCVTSPPYWGLRDYGVEGQLGLEATPREYIETMVEVFREVKRVLRDDGTLWLNIGDSYAGSWGAQSRGDFTPGTLEGASDKETSLSARQIRAHPKDTGTGSLKNTPGCKNKDLVGIPWMLAFALRDDGWYLRQDIIWHKPNPMPESIRDRCTKAHEYVFLMSKSGEPRLWTHRDRAYSDYVTEQPEPDYRWVNIETREEVADDPLDDDRWRRVNLWRGSDYYYDADAIKEPSEYAGQDVSGGKKYSVPAAASALGRCHNLDKYTTCAEKRNKRSVWSITTQSYAEAHFATFPEALVRPCILAGCPKGGTVLEPFLGSGTTLAVARQLGRKGIGIELNPEYVKLARERIGRAEKPQTFVSAKDTHAPLFQGGAA